MTTEQTGGIVEDGPLQAIMRAFDGMRARVRTDLRPPPEEINLYMDDKWLARVALGGLEREGYVVVKAPQSGRS